MTSRNPKPGDERQEGTVAASASAFGCLCWFGELIYWFAPYNLQARFSKLARIMSSLLEFFVAQELFLATQRLVRLYRRYVLNNRNRVREKGRDGIRH